MIVVLIDIRKIGVQMIIFDDLSMDCSTENFLI